MGVWAISAQVGAMKGAMKGDSLRYNEGRRRGCITWWTRPANGRIMMIGRTWRPTTETKMLIYQSLDDEPLVVESWDDLEVAIKCGGVEALTWQPESGFAYFYEYLMDTARAG
jgi:hypothetical protein